MQTSNLVWSETLHLNSVNKNAFREAATKEIQAALTKEAIKRGFKTATWVFRGQDMLSKCVSPKIRTECFINNNNFIYSTLSNSLSMDGYIIFVNGIWAEIIPTKTKEEAEKELNCKITIC